MEINEAIRTRRSIRRYKTDPVPKELLEKIIEAAQWSASAMNTQPWEVAIIGGDLMNEFKDRLTKNAEADVPEDLPYFSMPGTGGPAGLPEPYSERVKEYIQTSSSYHFPAETENLEEKKKEHFRIGGRIHEAPNAIILYMDKKLLDWAWGYYSLGIITQSICLAGLDYGLGTCVMARPIVWSDILRDLCNIPESKFFICAIAIGYPDYEARINNFPRTRIPLDDWVSWHGF